MGRNGIGRNSNNRDNQNDLTRSYSREEWDSLTPQQRSQIYRARERMNTARTVAALLREGQSNNANDEVSAITPAVQTIPVPQVVAAATTNQIGQGPTNANTTSINMSNVSNMMNRRTGAYNTVQKHTSIRQIQAINRSQKISVCRAELDTHADTCGVNNTALILEYTGQVADVAGFSDSIGVLKEVPIVKAALAYDHPTTGDTIVLIINQALHFGDNIQHMLLNPNQIRAHGIEVDDVPKHLTGGKSTHSIFFPEARLRIPLQLHGVISYFTVRTPTLDEVCMVCERDRERCRSLSTY